MTVARVSTATGSSRRTGPAALEASILPPRHALPGLLLAIAASFAAVPAARTENANPSPDAPAYDPTRGVEPDGRIPRENVPPGLPHPERWRYVPEGRLKPGDFLDRFLVSSFATPILYYNQEVGLGGGFSLNDVDFRNQRRQEYAGLDLSQTSEGQQDYSVLWQRWLHHLDLPAGGILQEERSIVRAFASYDKTLTFRFFGLGPDTKPADETDFSDARIQAGLLLEASLPGPADDWVLTLGARGEHHRLGRGSFPHTPDTREAFPGLFAEAEHHGSAWVTMGLRYDTRDSQHDPYSGWMAGARIDAAPLQSHGDLGAVFTASGSGVMSVPGLFHDGGEPGEENPPTDTIAVGAGMSCTAGELPFWALPSLGGDDTLRGYIGHRWTDRAAWYASTEYRFWWLPRGFALTDSLRVERLGSALFYEVGAVADGIPELPDSKVRQSYGVSLRVSFERMALFRIDVGFSDEGISYTAAYGLSF
jgi:hypothetical protein